MKAQARTARRIGIGLLAVCATLLVGGCAAGQLAATSEESPAIDGTTGHLGHMQLHGLAVVAPDGPCVLLGADAALTLSLVNTAHEQDSLTGVSSPRFASAVVVPTAAGLAAYASADTGSGSCASPSSSVAPTPSPTDTSISPSATPTATLPSTSAPTVAGGHALHLGVYDAGTNAPGVPTEPILLLRHLQNGPNRSGPLYPGESIPITFSFAKAGKITLQVPVQLSAKPNISILPTIAAEG